MGMKLIVMLNPVGEWLVDKLSMILIRICLWIDDKLFTGVAGLYDIFIQFAGTNLETEFPGIMAIGERIMLLLGVFMLFRVALLLIQYLLDPDKISDSSVGAAAIVKNIVISIALLATINPIFSFLYDFQNTVMEEKVLDKIVMGRTDTLGDDAVTIGEQLAYVAWISFFNESKVDGQGAVCANEKADCGEIPELVGGGIIADADTSAITKAMGYEDDTLKVVYNALFSTIAAIFLLVILLTFIIDVGIRMFKLLIYHFLAPVAIIAYIDPKEGRQVFNRWLKSLLMTYLDLFVRLMVILFAIVMISQLSDAMWNTEKLFPSLKGFSRALGFFLFVVAIFSFAKMLPGLIGDLFGVDMKSNSLKGVVGGMSRLAAGGIGLGVGAAGGLAVGAATGGALGAVKGALGGAARGATGGLKQNKIGGGFGAGKNAAGKTRDNALKNQKAGGFRNRMMGKMANVSGKTQAMQNKIDRAKAGASNLEQAQKASARVSARNFSNKYGHRINNMEDLQKFHSQKAQDRHQRLVNQGLTDTEKKHLDARNDSRREYDKLIKERMEALPSNEIYADSELAELRDVRAKLGKEESYDSYLNSEIAASQTEINAAYDAAEAEWNNDQTFVTKEAMAGRGDEALRDNIAAAKSDFEASGIDTSVLDGSGEENKSILNLTTKDVEAQINALEDDPKYKRGQNAG